MAEPLKARAIRGLVIGVVAAVLLAVAGAFGTDQVGLGRRLVYWFAVILPGSVLGLFVVSAIRAWGGLSARRWLEMAVAAVAVAVPHTFIVVVASVLAFGADEITVPTIVAFFGIVLMMSLVLTAINYATTPRVVTLVVPPPPAPPPQVPLASARDSSAMPPAFAERLPLRLRGGRLIALAAEDHYLRVHTDIGNDLVLMRMADAVALLADVPGARVHRSWWVARDAVVEAVRDGDRLELRLTCGLAAPVSRNLRRELGAAGWF